MTSEAYTDLINQIYSLINSELEAVESKDIAEVYPKLVVMYEFFRLLRGEGFDMRPQTPESQNRYYEMEDQIKQKINNFREKLDLSDEKTKHYLDQMISSFR